MKGSEKSRQSLLDEKMRLDRIKLATELVRQDMTQVELAKKIGVSRITVNGIRNGKSCSDEVGYKIAEALGVDISKLLEK